MAMADLLRTPHIPDSKVHVGMPDALAEQPGHGAGLLLPAKLIPS